MGYVLVECFLEFGLVKDGVSRTLDVGRIIFCFARGYRAVGAGLAADFFCELVPGALTFVGVVVDPIDFGCVADSWDCVCFGDSGTRDLCHRRVSAVLHHLFYRRGAVVT